MHKYNTDPRGVSLSKCCFHFRMCSATSISAAAAHSVPAVRSRFGATKNPASAEVQCSTRALATGGGTGKCRTECECLAQSPQQHRCAGSRTPAVQWRPKRSSGKLPTITQTPSYHCGPVLPSEQAAKFSVFTKTPQWILVAATLVLLHHPFWHKSRPCPPPRCPP